MTVTALRALPVPRSIEQVLWEARSTLKRLDPIRAARARDRGALLVDIRPHAQRVAEGEIPGSLVIERNVLEWRLDPQSAARIADASYDLEVIVVCSEGYTSSLAAASLQELGLARATDLEGGFQAWAEAGLTTAPGGTPTGQRTDEPRLISINADTWEVLIAGEPVHLTRQEFRVLSALQQAKGRVVPRSAMAELVEAYPATTRALDVHVCRVRRKLGPAADLLVTVRGVGWRLVPA